MDTVNNSASRIDELTRAIESAPTQASLYQASLYMERGKLHHQQAHYDLALNDFLRVQKLAPDNTEAQEYILLLREIFNFRNLDLYNP